MELKTSFAPLAEVSADWLVVGVWKDKSLPAPLSQLDEKLGGLLSRLVEAKDVSGKPNETTALYQCDGIVAKRLLVVGLGEESKASVRGITSAASAALRAITEKEISDVAVAIPSPVGDLNWSSIATSLAFGASQGTVGPWIRQSKPERYSRNTITFVAPTDTPQDEIQKAVEAGSHIAAGAALTRELVNLPPCDLYPETFAEEAKEVAAGLSLECEIWDEAKLRDENMGALLGVAQGSERPPRLVILRYKGGAGKTLGFVGKGVTFDSGGLSLKPSDGMLDMKCDMAGAATVLGAIQVIATRKLPVNVIGVMPLVENMPSGKALKLGDVLHARNSKTIEIHNTDAEGRLILADALAYTVEQKVDHLVDLATLTGACMVALGTEVVGLMSNNEEWSHEVKGAADEVGEYVWPLPMFPLYGEMIKSSVADIKNTGGVRWAGAITAAKLLEEFVGETPWVHLDIAGPSFADSENATRAAGATGVMVRTLVRLAEKYGEK